MPKRGRLQLDALVGVSRAMEKVRDWIREVAPTHLNVLVLGETGTGKELCARAIVAMGPGGPMVALNCGVVPEHLVESEAFGHEKGAFTGATGAREGLIAAAHGGTLFLDELGEAPLPFQVALLRTLDEGEYRRVGSTRSRHSRFRVIAATNADVDDLVEQGKLRLDFLHRLGIVRIIMPPLRKRPEDIPVLVSHFLHGLREVDRGAARGFAPAAIQYLMSRDWPGNVRELRQVVEAAAVLFRGPKEVSLEELRKIVNPEPEAPVPTLAEAVEKAERQAIRSALANAEGDVDLAAELLEVSRSTFYRKRADYFPVPGPEEAVPGEGRPVPDLGLAQKASVSKGNPPVSARWSSRPDFP